MVGLGFTQNPTYLTGIRPYDFSASHSFTYHPLCVIFVPIAVTPVTLMPAARLGILLPPFPGHSSLTRKAIPTTFSRWCPARAFGISFSCHQTPRLAALVRQAPPQIAHPPGTRS